MNIAYFAIARDTLLLLPRLAGASLGVFLGRQFADPTRQLSRFTSVDWLARLLELDPDQIESASVQAVHTGTASRSRLHIRYAGNPAEPPGPTSMFIKSSPPDFASALFGVLFNLGGNEVSFYRNIRPGITIRSPNVFHCEGDSKNYVMLLEDLTDKDCDFRDLASACTLEDATRVFDTLAELHAPFWQSDRFDSDLAWVSRFETNHDFRMLNLVRQLSVPIAIQKYGHVFPPSIREVIPHLLDNYQRLEHEWAREPRTLIHGDAHLGNMYFQRGRAGLLDFQVSQLGQGMRDIAYFLINSVPEEIRLAHQEELIRHYLARLEGLGISLDFETAWRQYRLQSVYAWIAGVVTAPSNFQHERVVVAGLARSCKAIVDLEAVDLIREL